MLVHIKNVKKEEKNSATKLIQVNKNEKTKIPLNFENMWNLNDK